MSTRTKPIRIFESDHSVIRLAAAAEGRSSADVMHSALEEYFANHREELVALFDTAREAIAAGDVDAIASGLARGSEQRVESMMNAD